MRFDYKGGNRDWSIAMKKLALAIVFSLVLTPALAQRQEGLVNVNVSNVLNDLNISDNLNNNTVQVPIGVAANVCGVNANVLAQQGRGGTASCTAKNVSQALRQAAQRQAGAQSTTASKPQGGKAGTTQGPQGSRSQGGTVGTAPSATKQGSAAGRNVESTGSASDGLRSRSSGGSLDSTSGSALGGSSGGSIGGATGAAPPLSGATGGSGGGAGGSLGGATGGGGGSMAR